MTTLVLEFKEIESDDETKFRTFYSNLKAEALINENDIDDVFESVYIMIISNIQKCSVWVTHSFIDHNINISR